MPLLMTGMQISFGSENAPMVRRNTSKTTGRRDISVKQLDECVFALQLDIVVQRTRG